MPPTEDELRAALQGGNPSGEIDLDAVLRRSRRRRRPRVVLAGAAGVLAVAAIVVPVSVSAITGQGFGFTSSSAAGDSADTAGEPAPAAGESTYSEQGLQRAPAEKLNLCTGPLAEVAPAESGLILTVAPVDAAATDTSIPVVITLSNTGTESISGTTAATPALTLSRDGITLWHSNGPQIMMVAVVDLAPGASMQYSTTFEPVVCSVEDDLGENFGTDLPTAGPGSYGLSAAIDLVSNEGVSELITGPVTPIALR